MTGHYKVRQARDGDFECMREEIATAIHPAVVVPGYDELAHEETELIVTSVEAAFRMGVEGGAWVSLVGTAEGRPAGFVIVERARALPEIRWIVALPGHIGCGLARALMREALARFAADGAMGLVVTLYNQRAIRFFRSFGFREAPPGGTSAARVLRMRRSAAESEPGGAAADITKVV